MPRIFRFVALLALVACPFCAQDPNDLSLALRLLKDQYAVNEPILFEVSLSTSTQRKYYANWTSLIPFGGPHILLEPHNSAVDLPAMQQIYAGSVLGSSGYLTATPVVETGDLTYWYRFEKAGHFRLSLAVDWVSRLKNADEGGGKEPIALQSNAVEFDILPPDPNRQAQELDSVLNDIDHSANTQFQPAALHRLELIQTPAAAQEEVRRYPRQFSRLQPLLWHSAHVFAVGSNHLLARGSFGESGA